MTTEIKIETKFDVLTGIIEQATTDVMGGITRQVVYTKEDQVRRALIALGWTPPPETPSRESAKDDINTDPQKTGLGFTEAYKLGAASERERAGGTK